MDGNHQKPEHIFGQLIPFEGIFPKLHPGILVASGVRIIGDVEIGRESSIWFNAVIRGDVNQIRIGEFTNIQDGCILHVSAGPNPLRIGNYVTVGHGAILHSCMIEDLTLIGMGSTVLDGAVVRKNSMVAAGSVVRPGFEVPEGKLVGGIPAKIIRSLTDEELNYFSASAKNYADYARRIITSMNEVEYEKY